VEVGTGGDGSFSDVAGGEESRDDVLTRCSGRTILISRPVLSQNVSMRDVTSAIVRRLRPGSRWGMVFENGGSAEHIIEDALRGTWRNTGLSSRVRYRLLLDLWVYVVLGRHA
jgi:hypothetical protein